MHQDDYEEFVRMPALQLIGDMEGELPVFSGYFNAQARKAGDSLMCTQLDTRFNRDIG